MYSIILGLGLGDMGRKLSGNVTWLQVYTAFCQKTGVPVVTCGRTLNLARMEMYTWRWLCVVECLLFRVRLTSTSFHCCCQLISKPSHGALSVSFS